MEEAGTMSRTLHTFEDQERLVVALSESIAKRLSEAIEEKGVATLLVSGGNTPKPLFKSLSNTPIAWENVRVGLVDERWIPTSDDASNEKLVHEHLLQNKAKSATFVGMYHESEDMPSAELACSSKIKASLYPFDVVILGMGADAHTASLFPHNEALEKAFDMQNESLCISMMPSTAPHMRMSLTRKAILSAKHIYLHIEGEEKFGVYEEALGGDDIYTMPIRSILNDGDNTIEVYYT